MLGVGVSLRHLRGTTAVDAYKVAGFSPQLVLDYENSKFRVSGSTSTAPSVVTATRTGLATQLDASGNLVWNAHNLSLRSEEFDNASWAKTSGGTGSVPVVTANAGIAPDGTNTADRIQFDRGASATLSDFSLVNQAAALRGVHTFSVWVKSNTGSDQTVMVYLQNNSALATQVVGSDWVKLSVTSGDIVSGIPGWNIGTRGTYGGDQTLDVLVWGAHVYRSDHGGMAPVPLTRRVAGSTTYVPTTSAAVYLPREEAYTYVSGSLVGPYYQKESDARTNLQNYSVPDSNWTVGGTTITENTSGVNSPDGEENWSLIEETASNAAHFAVGSNSITFTTGTTYTLSFFVKKASTDDLIQLTFPSAAFGTSQYANFNAGTGSFETVVGLATHIEDFGDGVYRVGITTSATATANAQTGLVLTNNDDTLGRAAVYLGVAGQGFYVWGFQVELGSTPTSYIPTAGSSVTRSADSTTIAAGNMPAYTDALSFQLEGLVTYADENLGDEVRFYRWELDPSNRITSYLYTAVGTGTVIFRQVSSGVIEQVPTIPTSDYSPGINVPFNIASRHGSTFINGAVDGTALTANTTPTTLPDLSATTFELAPTFNGFIKEFRAWADDIGDTGIAEAST